MQHASVNSCSIRFSLHMSVIVASCYTCAHTYKAVNIYGVIVLYSLLYGSLAHFYTCNRFERMNEVVHINLVVEIFESLLWHYFVYKYLLYLSLASVVR